MSTATDVSNGRQKDASSGPKSEIQTKSANAVVRH